MRYRDQGLIVVMVGRSVDVYKFVSNEKVCTLILRLLLGWYKNDGPSYACTLRVTYGPNVNYPCSTYEGRQGCIKNAFQASCELEHTHTLCPSHAPSRARPVWILNRVINWSKQSRVRCTVGNGDIGRRRSLVGCCEWLVHGPMLRL